MVILSGNFRWFIDNEEGEGFFSVEKNDKALKVLISELYKINTTDIFSISHITEVDLNNPYYLMVTDKNHYVDNPKVIKLSNFTIFKNKSWVDKVKQVLVENQFSSLKLLNEN